MRRLKPNRRSTFLTMSRQAKGGAPQLRHPAQRQEALVRWLEFLSRIFLQERRDLLGENFSKLVQFLFAHAVDEPEGGERVGVIMSHVTQGDVAENDVWRNTAFVCQRSPELAQLLEQRLIACDFTRL